ncbi:MAG: DNA polymerase IV [Bacilli bacterium]|nr:DNA polymerase IV [Bacilli bacterium]
MGTGRIIFHIDMNCFYVSCELVHRPELRDVPVAVAPNASRRKSIILSANYPARKFGIRAAMSVAEAQRLCPNIILLDSHFELYSEYSQKFFSYFFELTSLVEPASIDEGYLDVTDLCSKIDAVSLAEKIRKDLYEIYGLPCSIGIAPNKVLAKIASDMKKPFGITILRKRDVPKILWPMPVDTIPGVGKKTLPLLKMLKINTVGDLANYPDLRNLEEIIGPNNSKALIALANGEGSNVIDINRFNDASSISNSQTFDNDEFDISNIKSVLKILTNSVSYRLEKHQYKAYTFTLQLKYGNLKSISKCRSLNNPINNSKEMYLLLEDIFDDVYDEGLPIRLIGVSASKLINYEEEIYQISIFDNMDEEEKKKSVNDLITNLQQTFGDKVIKQGIEKENTFKYDKSYKKIIN